MDDERWPRPTSADTRRRRWRTTNTAPATQTSKTTTVTATTTGTTAEPPSGAAEAFGDGVAPGAGVAPVATNKYVPTPAAMVAVTESVSAVPGRLSHSYDELSCPSSRRRI